MSCTLLHTRVRPQLTLVEKAEEAPIHLEQSLILGIDVPPPLAQLRPWIDFRLLELDDAAEPPGQPEREGEDDEPGEGQEDVDEVRRAALHRGAVAEVQRRVVLLRWAERVR